LAQSQHAHARQRFPLASVAVHRRIEIASAL